MRYGIERIEYYLPEHALTADDLAKEHDFELEFIENKLGVKQLFHVVDQSASDLAVKVLQQLLEKDPTLRDNLDVLIVCTQTPDFQLPHVSAIVQAQVNLPENVAAFDVSLGCSGFVYGLSVIEGFLALNNYARGILINVDTYSKIIDKNDRNTRCLFSDAATATLISKNSVFLANKYIFGTAGDHYDKLIVRSSHVNQAALYMDGRAIFNFAVSKIPTEIFKLCEINQIKIEDIKYFVFHQASRFILNAISKKIIMVPPEKIIDIMGIAGNTVSCTIPMALKSLLTLGYPLSIGDHILISGFGVGLSWAGTILTVTEEVYNV